MKSSGLVIPAERIERRIFYLRGSKVMLSSALAELYGVAPKALNQAVRRKQLGLFIRKLIGLDREAAKQPFGQYLSRKTLTANQIRFIDQVIDYLTPDYLMQEFLYFGGADQSAADE
jgi:hypothetical protein